MYVLALLLLGPGLSGLEDNRDLFRDATSMLAPCFCVFKNACSDPIDLHPLLLEPMQSRSDDNRAFFRAAASSFDAMDELPLAMPGPRPSLLADNREFFTDATSLLAPCFCVFRNACIAPLDVTPLLLLGPGLPGLEDNRVFFREATSMLASPFCVFKNACSDPMDLPPLLSLQTP